MISDTPQQLHGWVYTKRLTVNDASLDASQPAYFLLFVESMRMTVIVCSTNIGTLTKAGASVERDGEYVHVIVWGRASSMPAEGELRNEWRLDVMDMDIIPVVCPRQIQSALDHEDQDHSQLQIPPAAMQSSQVDPEERSQSLSQWTLDVFSAFLREEEDKSMVSADELFASP
ncbi:hypothetical protein BCR43DRAFT_511221 [Syncephalastrum racemosum]|uniref:Uncharacterized protein n=1 Tax=Syncephalastrum racemosum TaxID=13706 RepID=A0A1X2HLG6_SYNRA|nr:hypothetical protein BCR43DRAFT_511221 [Syncephalastrum racemosum]